MNRFSTIDLRVPLAIALNISFIGFYLFAFLVEGSSEYPGRLYGLLVISMGLWLPFFFDTLSTWILRNPEPGVPMIKKHWVEQFYFGAVVINSLFVFIGIFYEFYSVLPGFCFLIISVVIGGLFAVHDSKDSEL